MANETRPRREPSGTSRLRKSSTPAPVPAPASPPDPRPASPSRRILSPSDSTPPAAEPSYRERPTREVYREEGPADREPIRYLRERPDASLPSERPGASARHLDSRAAGPRPRRARRAAPRTTRESPSVATAIASRDPTDAASGAASRRAAQPPRPVRPRLLVQFPRSRLSPPPRLERAPAPMPGSGPGRRTARCPAESFPTSRTRTSSATSRSTTATRTSSAARSTSPSCRR